MSNATQTLNPILKQLRAQREIVVDLDDGKSITLLRPREAELPAFGSASATDAISKAAVDWSGFTEATFLGDAVGSSDPLPFTAEVWDEVVRDNIDWLNRCLVALGAAITSYVNSSEIAAKN